MKIALDIRKIGQKKTGDEAYITNLVRNYTKLNQKNIYYLCTDTPEAEMKAKQILKNLPSNFIFKTLIPSRKAYWTMYALPKFLKKEKIDLVHVQYIAPIIMPKNTKLVVTIHDLSFKTKAEHIRRSDKFLLNFFIPKTLKEADRVISVSNFTRGEILKAYPNIWDRKVKTIYNGVSKEIFKPKEDFQASLLERVKAKYKLDKRFILNVGSLQPRKNIPALIEAFQEYIYSYRDEETSLVLVGEKGYNYDLTIDEALRDLTLKRRVKQLGYVKEEDLPPLLALASAYSSPSIYEGFNIPLVEAMSSAVPVVASDIPCHREIIQDSEIITNVDSTKGYAQELNTVLNDENSRQEMIKKGLLRSKFFSWRKCAKKTLGIYEKTLQSKTL